jgi:aspartyl aminopeptidase
LVLDGAEARRTSSANEVDEACAGRFPCGVTAPEAPSNLADLLAYLGASPTPFHAVVETRTRLVAAGFRELDERASWEGLGAGSYFVVAGETSLLAFVLPHGRKVTGFRIVGAHTDSPNLRLKPKPDYVKEGYAQLGVEVYGGALLNSWLDRDLGLAGRLLLRGSDGHSHTSRLVKIERPICRVAQLAIHLDREANDGLKLNRQEHLAPLFGLGTGDDVLTVCAKEIGVSRDDVLAHDLMLFDVTRPTLGGRSEEMFFSARLDNLAMCHAGTRALVAALGAAEAANVVPVLALFDHEEVGSESATGAQSAFLPRVLERISLATGASRDAHLRALASSLCVSADMAHAVHPNYADRHEARHKPVLNGGPVIKTNSQQRYATSGPTAALFRTLAKEADVPVQDYAHRTDLPCGTTIGPITSSLLGIRTVDVGNPMLSMHSVRELGGSQDPELMTRVMQLFFTCRDSA